MCSNYDARRAKLTKSQSKLNGYFAFGENAPLCSVPDHRRRVCRIGALARRAAHTTALETSSLPSA
jgi:hypothetical protein